MQADAGVCKLPDGYWHMWLHYHEDGPRERWISAQTFVTQKAAETALHAWVLENIKLRTKQ
jgi:hypothetical protein